MKKELTTKLNVLLHGGDYNPDQWLGHKEILEQDIEYMKKAGINCVSVGIFAWAALEPEEGHFTFEWLDEVLNNLYKNGIYFILATPSGARPVWMSMKYPEVLRVEENGGRIRHGGRHNHCYTSPVYREKVNIINRKLAERYSSHPGLLMWHISNEYGGACYCDLCQEAFRGFLKEKYQTIENLNHEWWNAFWAHTYHDFSQIEAPGRTGENSTNAMHLDWMRFVTKQTIDFYLSEIKPLKEMNPDIPCTTNFMGLYWQLNYAEFAKYVDVVSWDSYPAWHTGDDIALARNIAFLHEMNRSLKDKPFLLMESTPSMTNWQQLSKLKKPGMHFLSSLQAIAYGADSVQYFQWRKGRGSAEKFHGAVVDHDLSDTHRVFKDVVSVGDALKKLQDVAGTRVEAETALVYDWENEWAIGFSQGPRNKGMKYQETVLNCYQPFWENGVPVDIISPERDLNKYKLVIAPMLYMMKTEFAEKIKAFVKAGGTLVTTYFTDYVNENDLCHLGGFPGSIGEVLGIKADEMDALNDGETNSLLLSENNELGLSGSYPITDLCELLTLKGAKPLGVYEHDFYAGTSCLTVNQYGKGEAYHFGARFGTAFNKQFFNKLILKLNLNKALELEFVPGVSAAKRTDGTNDYIFLMNFNNREVILKSEKQYDELLSGEKTEQTIQLPPYGVKVLRKARK